LKKEGDLLMKFIVKDMDIATGGALVVTMNEKDAALLDLHHMDRVLVKKGRKKAVAIIDIAESAKAVPAGMLGLFEEVLDALEAVDKDEIEISIEKKPESVSLIRKKMDGKTLTAEEILEITKDIVANNLTDVELASYIAANYIRGMSTSEIGSLTKAMMQTGSVLKLDQKQVVDLHCIGGVPGNRTTMIVVPILAAAGLTVPKTASRAITSPAGTADTMESLCSVSLPLSKLKEILNKVGAFIIWGGAVNLAPADDRIIKVEYSLAIDAEGEMLASIMAKKLSVSATHLLIDIPIGKGAKVQGLERALHLKHHFESLSKELGIAIQVTMTDGTQPIGNGIGPNLEAKDCLWLLKNDPRGPRDLREKSLQMAAEIFEFVGKTRRGEGLALATEILDSGKAYKKMIEIIKAQGGKEIMPDTLAVGKYSHVVRAESRGKISHIDNIAIARIARMAGTPADKPAGILLHKHAGDVVAKGEQLYTLYSESEEKLKYAIELIHQSSGFLIVEK
jgi:putative thymidine phosphorylase